MGRKDKEKKKKKKEVPFKPTPPSEEKKVVASKSTPKASETIEKYKRKLEQERELEKELMEETKLHDEIVLPKLKTRELKEDEYITCPKCKQLTIVIEGKCSVCNAEIKK